MKIEIVPAYNHPEEIKSLFFEYIGMLIEGDSSFKEYLDIQNYDAELEHLEEKYGYPMGRLYLAYCGGQPAGCIGLRKIDEKNCEMKRLYVRPQFRNNRIGEQLVRLIVDDAKNIGYSFMLLDTLPFLESAVRLYKRFGFYITECYNDSPMSTSIFMKLDLTGL
ncbi:MAG: GNAT family N-acetyltransferase [Bacillota bacterium]|nr:GNAT family N-acetyltransferase [Bacillota bacterium]